MILDYDDALGVVLRRLVDGAGNCAKVPNGRNSSRVPLIAEEVKDKLWETTFMDTCRCLLP